MDIFITTFESVAVLLGIGLIGFLVIKRGILPENVLEILSSLALKIALPSLIFSNIITNFIPKNSPDWWQLPIWWLIFTGFLALLTYIFSRISKKEFRREFSISLFYQNGIFFPVAILSGIFGDASNQIVFLFLFTIFYPVFFFNTYQIFFKQKMQGSNLKRILNPVLIFTFTAILLRIFGLHIYVPDFVIQIANTVGGMTLPLIMLVIGGNIYLDFHKRGKLYLYEILKFVIVKNFIFPFILISILFFVRLDYTIALLLVLQSAVPPVTAVPIFTHRCGGNQSISNQFVVSSFIFSLISIPIALAVFNHIYS